LKEFGNSRPATVHHQCPCHSRLALVVHCWETPSRPRLYRPGQNSLAAALYI